MPEISILDDLLKQGGLAVGLVVVVLFGLRLLQVLKDALDREQHRNDRMREHIEDLTEGASKVAESISALNYKLDLIIVRLDNIDRYEGGRRR